MNNDVDLGSSLNTMMVYP